MPLLVYPIAPSGEQNAPGVTIGPPPPPGAVVFGAGGFGAVVVFFGTAVVVFAPPGAVTPGAPPAPASTEAAAATDDDGDGDGLGDADGDAWAACTPLFAGVSAGPHPARASSVAAAMVSRRVRVIVAWSTRRVPERIG
ncbi:hypothetical protein ACFFX1_55285 [Dactylosporangium sucinum]|uniref:hypothetical protein n=1 Tax=Dactylosporangium sucinum TaxID=1424081 RepID=UPI00167D5F61|nr:hypothetical protein [Dactylosporangium sucinum]